MHFFSAVLCCALGALVATSSSWWWNNDGGVVLVRAGGSSTFSMRGPTRSAAQKLLHGARRLEDNNNNNYYEPDEENTFLRNYSIHLLSCLDGEKVRNTVNDDDENQDSSYDDSAVIFRLCPTNTCDTNGATTNLGCADGYGDYVIGMHTFLALYRESIQDQNNDDDYYNPMMAYNRYGASFDASEYLECGEYDPAAALEQAQDNGYYYQYSGGYNTNQNYQNQQGSSTYGDNTPFYIGPGCTADGTTIGLQVYRDEDCTSAAAGDDTVDFARLSSGVWEDGLPFTKGGLIDLRCTPCARSQQQQQNDNDDEDDDDNNISDLCRNAYAQAATRCEEKTDFSTNQNYYGYAYGNKNNKNNYYNNGQDDDENTHYYYSQNNDGCEYIATLLSTVDPSSVSTIVAEAVNFMKEVASRSITTDPIVLAVTVLVALMAVVGTVVLYRAFVTQNNKGVSEGTEEKDVHNYVAATDNHDGALSAKQKIEEAEWILNSVHKSEQDEETTPIPPKKGWFS